MLAMTAHRTSLTGHLQKKRYIRYKTKWILLIAMQYDRQTDEANRRLNGRENSVFMFMKIFIWMGENKRATTECICNARNANQNEEFSDFRISGQCPHSL